LLSVLTLAAYAFRAIQDQQGEQRRPAFILSTHDAAGRRYLVFLMFRQLQFSTRILA